MARASTVAGGHGGTSPESGVLSTGAAYDLRQPARKRKGIQAVLTGHGLGRGRDAAGLAARMARCSWTGRRRAASGFLVLRIDVRGPCGEAKGFRVVQYSTAVSNPGGGPCYL